MAHQIYIKSDPSFGNFDITVHDIVTHIQSISHVPAKYASFGGKKQVIATNNNISLKSFLSFQTYYLLFIILGVGVQGQRKRLQHYNLLDNK